MSRCPRDCEWPSSDWADEGAPCPRHGRTTELETEILLAKRFAARQREKVLALFQDCLDPDRETLAQMRDALAACENQSRQGREQLAQDLLAMLEDYIADACQE